MPVSKLNRTVIAAAIEGFESQKRRIDNQIAELRQMLNGGPAETAATPEAPARKRKKFSAAARRKMALAQKARWAKIRGEAQQPAPAQAQAPKPKRKLSAAGRAAIIAAAKKRRARVRAAKAQQERAVRKPARKKAPAKEQS